MKTFHTDHATYHSDFTREEWLALRASDITSTEASALFHLSPYETYFELWHRKKSGTVDGIDDNERMQAGRHIEPAIASLVAERYGVTVEPLKDYARHDRMGASFDFQITDVCDDVRNTVTETCHNHGGGYGILECKNVDFLQHRQKWTEDECPDHIEIQLQHQLHVSGMAWGVIAALVGGNRLWIYIRERDAKMGAAIARKVNEFWRTIEANESPSPIMPDDAAAVIAMHQFADSSLPPLDARGNEDMLAMAKRYHEAGKGIALLEEDRDVIKAKMLTMAGDSPKILLDEGYSFTTSQTSDTPPTVVTAEMVGSTYGGRRGYRQFRINAPKKTKEPAT